jgi:hypothetical protein
MKKSEDWRGLQKPAGKWGEEKGEKKEEKKAGADYIKPKLIRCYDEINGKEKGEKKTNLCPQSQ